jgi:predicted nucleic acid-binding protein
LKYDQVAVDASFLLKMFLPEEKSDEAETLWKAWVGDHVEIMAPTLIVFEVSSVIRNKVFRGNLTEKEGEGISNLIKEIDLSLIYTPELLDIAWEIGTILNTPNLYDCFYLALPRLFRIPLWTADKKLFQSAKKEFPFINLL